MRSPNGRRRRSRRRAQRRCRRRPFLPRPPPPWRRGVPRPGDYPHRPPPAIQIRRSTDSSVTRESDLRGLVDVGDVQTYVINGTRVIFLSKRGPQHKHGRDVVKVVSLPAADVREAPHRPAAKADLTKKPQAP